MKKSVILTLLLLIGNTLYIGALESVSEIATLRDSIFRELKKIDDNEEKVYYLQAKIQNHVGQDWTVELLDSALAISQREHLNIPELKILFDYCRHYQFVRNHDSFHKYLEILKEKSYSYKDYRYYLSAWVGEMQYSTTNGQTEYVILESKKMTEELKRVGFGEGSFAVSLVLGNALTTAGRQDEAIKVYQDVLEQKTGNRNGRIRIHSRLANIYRNADRFNEAISELEKREVMLSEMYEETPEGDRAKFRNHWLETYTAFARIYSRLNDKDNLKKYLLKAKEFHFPGCFYTMDISYHSYWGSYYQMTKEWDKCFEMYDIALSRFNDDDPIYRNNVLNMKVEAYEEAGMYKEAAELYKDIILKKGSLNQTIANQNEELHRANYQIQEELVTKERNKFSERVIEAFIALVFILILLVMIVRSIRIHAKLRKSEAETRAALALTESTDKLKENFLRNITYEVRIPLNTVVGFSDILSTEKHLSQKERIEYSNMIKASTEKLLLLINNVLDLSRLESGMMSFHWEELDAIQLCKEAKMMVEMQNNRIIKMEFNTNKPAMLRTDSRWFIKVLINLLINTNPEPQCKAECIVDVKNGKLILSICNCHKYRKNQQDEQNKRILQNINQLFINQCGGEITSYKKDEHTRLVITLPLSN